MTMYEDLVKKLRYLATVYKVCGNESTNEYRLAVEAADAIEELSKMLDEEVEVNTALECNVPVWVPITTRPMTEEERKETSERIGYDLGDDEAVVFTSQLPEDDQVVLTLNRYKVVNIDTFENDPDYGCSFYENGDMDGIIAWMPLPNLPKEMTE